MLLDLKGLKPNPFRDFKVDPIDEDNVAVLAQSIQDDGFWGGVTARKLRDGTYQVAAGHHRISAAMKSGMTKADIFVGDFDDSQMIRIYARENATQRGNHSAAVAGSVASAIRFLAKAVLTGDSQIWESLGTDAEKVRIHLTNDKGLGEPVITEFLSGVPGIKKGVVAATLGALKDSGDYARIIGEVTAAIEEENKEALKAAAKAKAEAEAAEKAAAKAETERKEAAARAKAARDEAAQKRAEHDRQVAEANSRLAEKRKAEADKESAKFDAMRKTSADAKKAAAVSADRDVTFDFAGVAAHLKNDAQLQVFRQQVTGPGITPYLSVKQQAALAKALVARAKRDNRELSGAFIKEFIVSELMDVKRTERKITAEQKAALARRDLQARAKQYQDEFAHGCRSMTAAGTKLADLHKNWPKDLAFPITGEFRKALANAKTVIDRLTKQV